MAKKSLTMQILEAHLVAGELIPGTEIGISIDQTLTQDATGTMACLQFEAMDIPRVRTKLSVNYVDHNMLQTGFENMDDHRFLQTFAGKHGIHFSRPGNGICHQVHLERFATPGDVLLGADSHTPTAGGMGMLAIGAGGLDIAVAMGAGPFYMTMPKVVGVNLTGELQPWVSAKDIILEMLSRLSVKGGVGRIFEYHGSGVDSLSVPERGTITNMGAELGATTSIFASDEKTKAYLKAQKRDKVWKPCFPENNAEYDELIEINLDELEPLIACPQSPDNVKPISELVGLKTDQVCVGSCTNSSYFDLMTVASVLKGKHVAPDVTVTLTPGSKQVFEMIARQGALTDFISAGARVLESACGPCIGMGQAPGTDTISLRTFNRNFPGRSGVIDDKVYLCSPEVAAASSVSGVITDPRTLGKPPSIELPEEFHVDDSMILAPADDPSKINVFRGPNIQPLPRFEEMPDTLEGQVVLKVGDNITTDHISPAGAKILPLRSNLPALSEFTYYRVDEGFVGRCKANGGGFIIGGENYGQGSSREHAALAPRYLGIKAKITKTFARIHFANLVNFGILPLVFDDPSDYDRVDQGAELEMPDVRHCLQKGLPIVVRDKTRGTELVCRYELTERQIAVVLAGGLLNQVGKAASVGQ